MIEGMGINPDICGRCTVIMNATSMVVALLPKGGKEVFGRPTDYLGLRRWIQDKLYGDNATFFLDNSSNAIIAVMTWYGDPVCYAHAVELRQREMSEPIHYQRERHYR